jgi:hypothetical protein
MTVRDYIGTTAIVLTFFLFMIHGVELDILKKEHVVLEDAIINWREKQQSEVRSSFINRSENLYVQFGSNMKFVTKGTFFKLINDDYLQMTKMYNKC